MSVQPSQINRLILVDDNKLDKELDCELAQWSLSPESPNTVLECVSNGQDAIAFLRAEGNSHPEKRTDLVLMELETPVMDGRQTMRQTELDKSLCAIPVAVLVTAASDRGMLASEGLLPHGYIVKPIAPPQIADAIKTILWFHSLQPDHFT